MSNGQTEGNSFPNIRSTILSDNFLVLDDFQFPPLSPAAPPVTWKPQSPGRQQQAWVYFLIFKYFAFSYKLISQPNKTLIHEKVQNRMRFKLQITINSLKKVKRGRDLTVDKPTLHPLSAECCPSLLLSSPGLALQVGRSARYCSPGGSVSRMTNISTFASYFVICRSRDKSLACTSLLVG